MSSLAQAEQTAVQMTSCAVCGREIPQGSPSIATPQRDGWCCHDKNCPDLAELAEHPETQQQIAELFGGH